MKRSFIHYIIASMLTTLFFSSCEKEITLDYRDIDPILVIEGRVTNEGCYVKLGQSRSMSDSVKSRCLQGAKVTISSQDATYELVYDRRTDNYRPAADLKGTAGTTYQMTVVYEGRTYTATSTMPAPAPFISAQFLWQPMFDNGLLMYEFWITDPEPDSLNYYMYRMERRAVRADVRHRQKDDPYRWGTFTDRGSLPGRVSRDIMCVNEEMMRDEEIEDDQLKNILFEGDTLSLHVMTLDRSSYEFYRTLTAGQSMGANAKSNITGGCLGCFLAGNITRWPTVIYSNELIIRK